MVLQRCRHLSGNLPHPGVSRCRRRPSPASVLVEKCLHVEDWLHAHQRTGSHANGISPRNVGVEHNQVVLAVEVGNVGGRVSAGVEVNDVEIAEGGYEQIVVRGFLPVGGEHPQPLFLRNGSRHGVCFFAAVFGGHHNLQGACCKVVGGSAGEVGNGVLVAQRKVHCPCAQRSGGLREGAGNCPLRLIYRCRRAVDGERGNGVDGRGFAVTVVGEELERGGQVSNAAVGGCASQRYGVGTAACLVEVFAHRGNSNPPVYAKRFAAHRRRRCCRNPSGSRLRELYGFVANDGGFAEGNFVRKQNDGGNRSLCGVNVRSCAVYLYGGHILCRAGRRERRLHVVGVGSKVSVRNGGSAFCHVGAIAQPYICPHYGKGHLLSRSRKNGVGFCRGR